MPTLAGNKHLSVRFFLHEPRLIHLSTEKVGVQSVKNGHKSGFSRANTIKNNINQNRRKFPQVENTKIHRKSNLEYLKYIKQK